MNPVVPILLLIGGALAWSVLRTAKAVVNLNYNVTRFGIYRFASDGNLIFRLRIRFTNPQNTPLTVNMIDIGAYLDSVTSYDSAGKVVVSSRGSLIASLNDYTGFVIPALSFLDKDFLINVRWADIGRYILKNAVSIITSITNADSINNIISLIVGKPILIAGFVKAENVTINIANVVSLTDDRNS